MNKTITEIHKLYLEGKTSPVKLTEGFLSYINETNPRLNSFVTICNDNALKDAEEAEKRIKSGKNVTPLTGIPIGLKDILVTKGLKTTCGSKILANYIPPYSATVVKKLREAGAVIMGKLNMDEFAMGSSNEHSAFGPVKNPHNIEYTPGGSSGGSAAAVASGQCVSTIGTDKGG